LCVPEEVRILGVLEEVIIFDVLKKVRILGVPSDVSVPSRIRALTKSRSKST